MFWNFSIDGVQEQVTLEQARQRFQSGLLKPDDQLWAPSATKLRGETVISYDAIVMFPRGHRTEYLGEGSPEAAARRMEQAQQRGGFDFGALNQAAGDCGRFAKQSHAIKPQQPGARIKFSEEDAI